MRGRKYVARRCRGTDAATFSSPAFSAREVAARGTVRPLDCDCELGDPGTTSDDADPAVIWFNRSIQN